MIIYYFIFSIFIFSLGLCMGSFVNALTYRLNLGLSMWDRSMCPKCKHKLNLLDLIPVCSFLFLKAKCRYCKSKISWQYPLVEFIAGVIFLLIYLKFIINYDFINYGLVETIDLSLLFICAIILVTIFIYDLKYYIIPNKVLFPGIILGIIILIFKSIYTWSLELAITHAFSIFIVFGFFLVLYLLSKGKWIGAGDVKFGILLGLILPWQQSLIMLFFTYVIGAIVGIILLISKKKKLKEKVPMGTFLVIGTFISIFFGEIILEWYLNLIL